MEFLFIYVLLIKPAWQQNGSAPPYNWEMNCCSACQRPNVHSRLETKLGSETLGLQANYPFFLSTVDWRWEQSCCYGLKVRAFAVGFSGPCENTRESVTIVISWEKAGWPLLKLQWPRAWTLLLPIPCPTLPLGICDLKFIRNHTLFKGKGWLCLIFFISSFFVLFTTLYPPLAKCKVYFLSVKNIYFWHQNNLFVNFNLP